MLVLKQVGLQRDDRNEYCTREAIFMRRFGCFFDLVNPQQSTFGDFLEIVNRDALSKPQFMDQARTALEREETFLADPKQILQETVQILQKARKFLDDARKAEEYEALLSHIPAAGLHTAAQQQTVVLIKVAVAATLATTKIIQCLAPEGDRLISPPEGTRFKLKVNTSYHPHIPVYEVHQVASAAAAVVSASSAITGVSSTAATAK